MKTVFLPFPAKPSKMKTDWKTVFMNIILYSDIYISLYIILVLVHHKAVVKITVL